MASKRKSRDWVRDEDRESFTKGRYEPLCSSSYNPFGSDFYCSFHYDDEFDHDGTEDDTCSVGSNELIDEICSVGSNELINEITLISDDDEADSPVRVDFQENRGCPSVEEMENNQQVFLENYSAAAIAEKVEHEEQERLFLMNYGALIIDNYGNLMGEFQHLDDDLIIPE